MGRFTTIAALTILLALAVAMNCQLFQAPVADGVLDVTSIKLDGRAFRNEPMDPQFLSLLGARSTEFRSYGSRPDEMIWTFLAWFDRPREGSQVHSPKNCYPGSGWAILSESAPEAPWGNGRIHRLIVGDGNARRLVDYWFQRTDGVITSVFELKRRMVMDALHHRSGSMIFVRVSTPLGGPVSDCVQRIESADRELHSKTARLLGDTLKGTNR